MQMTVSSVLINNFLNTFLIFFRHIFKKKLLFCSPDESIREDDTVRVLGGCVPCLGQTEIGHGRVGEQRPLVNKRKTTEYLEEGIAVEIVHHFRYDAPTFTYCRFSKYYFPPSIYHFCFARSKHSLFSAFFPWNFTLSPRNSWPTRRSTIESLPSKY